MIPTAGGLYLYFTIDHSKDDPDWGVRLFLHFCMELVGILFLLSVLGLIWSVCTPMWLTRLSQFLQRHLVRGLNSFLFVLVGMLVLGALALLFVIARLGFEAR